MRLVGRIREALRLQRDAAVWAVPRFAFSQWYSGNEVAGIQMYDGLGREDVDNASARWLGEPCGEARAEILAATTRNPVVVIVAATVPQLVMPLAEARPEPRRRAEIERRVLHVKQPPGRNHVFIDLGELVRVERQLVPQDIALPCQVEIAVMREIDRRRAIAGSCEIDNERVIVGQRVCDRGVQRAGVALVAVRADVAEMDGLLGGQRPRFPKRLVETHRAAMQVVRALVRGQLVATSIK